jgi:hypothetical protein
VIFIECVFIEWKQINENKIILFDLKKYYLFDYNMPKQVDKYDKERKEVLNQIFQILGINEANNKFLLHELDANVEKQNQILELESNIKKYFICGKWNCFTDSNVKRKYLSIIKCLLKDMGLQIMITTNIIKDDESVSKRRKVYHIVKNI